MRQSLATLVVLLCSGGAWTQVKADSSGPVLAITHVTVIDATGVPAQADQTIVIKDGRIVALGKSADTPPPASAEIVEGAGKFLIPGLWDMHAHIAVARPTAAPEYLALFLANGVTGVREMHAFFPNMIFSLRKAIESGKLAGPRIVAAGAMIDGPRPTSGGALVATDAGQGRAAVQSLKKRGADFIKVHSKLPRDVYFAIADEAKKQGLPFAGHVPESVSALEASDAGQRSIEHLTGLWISRSEEHTSELQSRFDLVCRLLLEKKKQKHHLRSLLPELNIEIITHHFNDIAHFAITIQPPNPHPLGHLLPYPHICRAVRTPSSAW